MSPVVGGYTLPMKTPEFVREALAALELEQSEEVLGRLGAYLGMLLEVNQRMNLTAVRDEDAAWIRLIVDSLTALPGMPEAGGRVLDVGTGGGLPGLPLAIARPDLAITLLETTGKKCDFLREVVAALELANVTVLQGRAENLGRDQAHRAGYDVVISRAVGAMRVLLEFTMPFAKTGGVVLAMKGPRIEQELSESGDALALLGAGEVDIYEAYPEGFENDLVIVRIEKTHDTPKEYPREPGIPKKQPL